MNEKIELRIESVVLFKNIIKNISHIYEYLNIDFSEQEICLFSTNIATTCYFECILPTNILNYYIINTQMNKYQIVLPLKLLSQCIQTFENNVEFGMIMENNKLILRSFYKNNTQNEFTLSIFALTNERFVIPYKEYTEFNSIMLNCRLFQTIISNTKITEASTLSLTSIGDNFIIEASGDICEYKKQLINPRSVEKIVKKTYKDRLKQITGLKSMSNKKQNQTKIELFQSIAEEYGFHPDTIMCFKNRKRIEQSYDIKYLDDIFKHASLLSKKCCIYLNDQYPLLLTFQIREKIYFSTFVASSL